MIFENVEPLILASASPRRAALLQSIGVAFRVIPSGAEESGYPGEPPHRLAESCARDKAVAVAEGYRDCWVLAADTVVVADDTVFGKPCSPDDARTTLRLLSGRAHRVVTGMALVHHGHGVFEGQSVQTEVSFKDLDDGEIASYVQTGKPMDKAGSYGIQGAGAFLVRSISGSYTNVVGLPLAEVVDWLRRHGVIRPRG